MDVESSKDKNNLTSFCSCLSTLVTSYSNFYPNKQQKQRNKTREASIDSLNEMDSLLFDNQFKDYAENIADSTQKSPFVRSVPAACFAVDINPEAARISRQTAINNRAFCFDVVNGDLLGPFTPR